MRRVIYSSGPQILRQRFRCLNTGYRHLIYLLVLVRVAPQKTTASLLDCCCCFCLARSKLSYARYSNRCLLYYGLGFGCWIAGSELQGTELELLCDTRASMRVYLRVYKYCCLLHALSYCRTHNGPRKRPSPSRSGRKNKDCLDT